MAATGNIVTLVVINSGDATAANNNTPIASSTTHVIQINPSALLPIKLQGNFNF